MEYYVCPFCGCEKVEKVDGVNYECPECEVEYTDDEREHELCRQRISALIMGSTEDNPKSLNGGVPIGEDREENCGLSSLDLPWANEVFQDTEAIVWIKTDSGALMEADELTTDELKSIEEILLENS